MGAALPCSPTAPCCCKARSHSPSLRSPRPSRPCSARTAGQACAPSSARACSPARRSPRRASRTTTPPRRGRPARARTRRTRARTCARATSTNVCARDRRAWGWLALMSKGQLRARPRRPGRSSRSGRAASARARSACSTGPTPRTPPRARRRGPASVGASRRTSLVALLGISAGGALTDRGADRRAGRGGRPGCVCVLAGDANPARDQEHWGIDPRPKLREHNS
jgi:hypothetical protein